MGDPSTESTRLSKNIPRTIIPSPGYIERRERLLKDEGDREERIRQQSRGELWEKSGVPKRHREFIRDRMSGLFVDDSPWGTTARDLLTDVLAMPSIVALVGPRGTGKTQMAVWVMLQVIKDRIKPCRYRKTLDFFSDLHKCYNNRHLSEEDMAAEYVKPYLLVMDEITVRRETKDEDRALTGMLDKRYDAMVPTILIGNCTADSLKENIGESIYSRLRETGGIIECNWKSFRGKS